jgi:hypothetical protein
MGGWMRAGREHQKMYRQHNEVGVLTDGICGTGSDLRTGVLRLAYIVGSSRIMQSC